jgi:hypothetical protein
MHEQFNMGLVQTSLDSRNIVWPFFERLDVEACLLSLVYNQSPNAMYYPCP